LTHPKLSGVHHLTLPVSDLEAAMEWYGTALGATHVSRFDHHDGNGARYAVVMDLPGLDLPLELRLAPAGTTTAAYGTQFGMVTFAVADRAALERWAAHLDACEVERSPVTEGHVGFSVRFASPDGVSIQLYTAPVGGFTAVEFSAR
jgi:catechol 2,3-dioxygenase-like lactoylglutathione lyase family enzyme